MANLKKTYFLAPSFDLPPPPTGPIQLGSILVDPFAADRPLNPAATLLQPPPESVVPNTKYDCKLTSEKSCSTSIGLYAKFLQFILGAGADASVDWNAKAENEYAFDKLETVSFNPTQVMPYVEAALRAPEVRRFVEKSKLRKPVYMVTGLKIARGAKMSSKNTKGSGNTFSVGLDGTGLGVPVEAGPKMELSREKSDGVSWGSSDDFVFAYRLSKLTIKPRTGEVKEHEYIKGALYETAENVAIPVEVGYELDTIGLDEDVAASLTANGEDVYDEEGETCYCIPPTQHRS